MSAETSQNPNTKYLAEHTQTEVHNSTSDQDVSCLNSLRWMPVWRSRWWEAVPHRSAVGWGAVWLRLRCRVSRESTPQPGHLPVSVQGEPAVVSAAGQEVQPKHLQVRRHNPAEVSLSKALNFSALHSKRLPAEREECLLWGMKLSQVCTFWVSASWTLYS